jgi:hypothetical protein
MTDIEKEKEEAKESSRKSRKIRDLGIVSMEATSGQGAKRTAAEVTQQGEGRLG